MDPDQTALQERSDLGLHYMLKMLLDVSADDTTDVVVDPVVWKQVSFKAMVYNGQQALIYHNI